MRDAIPITGVVGVVGGDAGLVVRQLEALRSGVEPRPDAVEIRADLFENPLAAFKALDSLVGRIPTIFTVRLPGHGGKHEGPEAARIELYRKALSLGTSLVDAEWESEAARVLAREGAPLIASHHDFSGMPGKAEIDRITTEMARLRPRVLKLVPAAKVPVDSVRMLEWVEAAPPGGPARVGFAMGEMGIASRVLSMSRGAPFTYASLGRAVAPGQATVADMVVLYRARELRRTTRVFGVAGNPVSHSLSPHLHNPAFRARGIDAVYLPLCLPTFPELAALVEPLGIAGLSVTIPFKEDALRFAGEADERSVSSGAANTLLFDPPARPRAFNTDFDGVLEPLSRRNIDPRGLSVAIVGNGGAARGAARALKEAGASVTIYYRNALKGKPVAEALHVASRPLGELERGRHGLILNATPLGLDPMDSSPVLPDVFDRGTWAFDMIYEPAVTAFLSAAESAGARAIGGREMLISQARVQFRLFTGQDVPHEELEEYFARGLELRRQ